MLRYSLELVKVNLFLFALYFNFYLSTCCFDFVSFWVRKTWMWFQKSKLLSTQDFSHRYIGWTTEAPRRMNLLQLIFFFFSWFACYWGRLLGSMFLLLVLNPGRLSSGSLCPAWYVDGIRCPEHCVFGLWILRAEVAALWGRTWSVVLDAELQQGFPISINVVMASEDLATPGAVCLHDQVVPWEIPSLGQGLGGTGLEKPTADQACKNYCR